MGLILKLFLHDVFKEALTSEVYKSGAKNQAHVIGKSNLEANH